MLSYPIALAVDDTRTILVTSPDFPELATFGQNRDEALARAIGALEDAISARIQARRDLPSPSRSDLYATLPTLTAIKVILYRGMRDQGMGKADLARRLDWHPTQVDRVLDLRHRSRLDRMDAALRALGLSLHVSAKDLPPPPA